MPFKDIQGNLFFLDVGFKRLKLAIEIDGRIHERDRRIFESDRWRQNALVLAGWRVLRFTVQMLEDNPDLVLATIWEALAH
jgi:very-short-patch-repair endonuclease